MRQFRILFRCLSLLSQMMIQVLTQLLVVTVYHPSAPKSVQLSLRSHLLNSLVTIMLTNQQSPQYIDI